MSTAMTTMKKWQDDYMDFVGRIEEPVVKYTARAAESMAKYVPERPDWAFLDEVPTMSEFVDSQLKFRKRLVDEQAAFVRKMMKAMHPALVRLESKPAAPARKAPVAKPAAAARKAPLRRVGIHAA